MAKSDSLDKKTKTFLKKVALLGVDIKIDSVQYAEIARILQTGGTGMSTGGKIRAIKELRGYTGCGLKEAKDAVNILEAQMPDPN